MEKISFEQLIKKVGLADVFSMFYDRIPEDVINKFTFKEWKEIYIELRMGRGMPPAVSGLIMRKMIKTAENLGELLKAYQFTEDKSSEEEFVLLRLNEFQNSESWLGMFKDKSISVRGKALLYLKEKIKDLVDLPAKT